MCPPREGLREDLRYTPPREGGLREGLRYTDKKVWQFQSGTLVIGRQLIQGEMGKADFKLVRIN